MSMSVKITWLAEEGLLTKPHEYPGWTVNNRPVAYIFDHHLDENEK